MGVATPYGYGLDRSACLHVPLLAQGASFGKAGKKIRPSSLPARCLAYLPIRVVDQIRKG